MTTRTTTLIVLSLILAAAIAGLVFWNRFPDMMASHWNANDQVDDYLPKFWGVFMMPLVALGMFLLFLAIPLVDPLKANIAQFRGAYNLLVTLFIGFMLYLHALTLAWNLGYTGFRMSQAMLPAMGLLFFFVSGLLRQAKRNWFIGIRTPWTLASDTVWEKTHRLGGVLFMFVGVLALVGGFLGGLTAFWFVMIPLVGSTLFLVAYSYVAYRREMRA